MIAQGSNAASIALATQRTAYDRRLQTSLNKLAAEEHDAERRGDLRAAEIAYSKMLHAGATEREVDRTRYVLFEKEGRGKEAYHALKIAVTNMTGSLSTDAMDPAMLTHFASLAERFGKKSEAAGAYRKAVTSGLRYMGEAFYPVIDSESTFRDIKCAAYYTTGLKKIFQGKEDEGAGDMRDAVKIASQNWLPHFGLAYALRCRASVGAPGESVKETKKAIALAPSELEGTLRQQLKVLGMPDGTDLVNIATTDQHGHLHIKQGHRPHG